MDTLKMKTLEQVDAALEAVEDARADKTLSAADKTRLEKAAVTLRNLERTIIKIVQKELVSSLKTDSQGLKDLSAQINASSDKLAGLGATIAKAASVVDAFIKIITTAVASGLI